MFKFNQLISKWTISRDCKTSFAEHVLLWLKESKPKVIQSKKNNPVKIKS